MSIVGTMLEQNVKMDTRANKLPDKNASDAFLQNLDEYDAELDEELNDEINQDQVNYDLTQGEFTNEQGQDEGRKNQFFEEEEDSEEESQGSASEKNSKSSKQGLQSSFWVSETTRALTQADYLSDEINSQIETDLIDIFNEENINNDFKNLDTSIYPDENDSQILINADAGSEYEPGDELILENDEAIKDQNFLDILNEYEHLDTILITKDQKNNSDPHQSLELELELEDGDKEEDAITSIFIEEGKDSASVDELSIAIEDNIDIEESSIQLVNNQTIATSDIDALDLVGFESEDTNISDTEYNDQATAIFIGHESDQHSNQENTEHTEDESLNITAQDIPEFSLNNSFVAEVEVIETKTLENDEISEVDADTDVDSDLALSESNIVKDNQEDELNSSSFGEGSKDDQNRKEIIDLYRKEIMKGIFEISLADGRQAVIIQLGGALENVSIMLTRRNAIWFYQFTFIFHEDYLFFYSMRDIIQSDMRNNLNDEFEIVFLNPEISQTP